MMKRLLITGAAGGLGAMCRERLTHLAETIVVSDRDGLGEAAAHEEIIYCDLGDKAAVEAMVEGCVGIVHLGGQPIEHTWEVVKNANIDGVFNRMRLRANPLSRHAFYSPVQITRLGFMNKQCALMQNLQRNQMGCMAYPKCLERRWHQCIMTNLASKPLVCASGPVFQSPKIIGCYPCG